MLGLAIIAQKVLLNTRLAYLLYAVATIISGYKLVLGAGKELLYGRKFDVELLVVIAGIGAFLIGEAEEGAAVVFLFYVANFLEEYATYRARKSIRELMETSPEKAVVKKGGVETILPVEDVELGDIVICRPGDKIPLDGVVVEGMSSVNEAPLTGESVPVEKKPGDMVYAGTLNIDGYLEIKVTKKKQDTVLARVLELVEQYSKSKSRYERFTEKFSAYYTPTILALAMLSIAIPALRFGTIQARWIYRALSFLVISCPCALAISIPVSMVSALTNAAKSGVLIKGSRYLETVASTEVFAFDKTGTLTKGELEVTDLIPLRDGVSPKSILMIAASLETRSEHPIARAIVEKAKEEGIKIVEPDTFSAHIGMGISGEINRSWYAIGSQTMVKESGFDYDEIVSKLRSEGKTCVFLMDRAGVIGIIALRDAPRAEITPLLHRLRKLGLKTLMLTGDDENTARAIAREVGIETFRANLLPEDKVNVIEELTKSGVVTTMVGDGINDAPALARSSVGIVMGGIGSDAAIEAGDIVLLRDNIGRLSYLIDLSRKTIRVVKQNIVLAVSVKLALALLAALGRVPLWAAVGVGDVGLSLVVTLNAMRLLVYKGEYAKYLEHYDVKEKTLEKDEVREILVEAE
ncbi:MAG TPA: cadmium-translocating P-type ATPase [Candidatus Korarchaeota archaeon]|nr:cadmium-translocating P-type ATPase [Candidatus Korarchaeota archaeon]